MSKGPTNQARSVARLAAVQALYQMEAAGAGVETVVREFTDHRFDGDFDGATMAQADEDLFAKIVRGAVEEQGPIDKAVSARLAEGWKLDRIDATLRAIFRAGGFELLGTETPTEIVIDDYVEIAKSFFDGPEPGFVNAALDGIAKDGRG